MDWQELVESILDEIARHRDGVDRRHVESARLADAAPDAGMRGQHSAEANQHMAAANALSQALRACERLYDEFEVDAAE